MKVLVTGATGFIGRALVPALVCEGHDVRAVGRTKGPVLDDAEADWRPALDGCDAVVHLAAMVHVMKNAPALAQQFRAVNVQGTARLAEQAARSGVGRFVMLSSVKVHGEAGHISESSARSPLDPYGLSKRDAEDALADIGVRHEMDVVVVRPPLVYGPGVRANFAALASAVKRGVPLPFGAINNRRSLVGLDNLVSLLALCLVHPKAANEAFLVSDGEDVSTPELVRAMAAVLGREARLFSVPQSLLTGLARAFGRGDDVLRLVGSLTVDIGKARQVLEWQPPRALDAGLREALL